MTTHTAMVRASKADSIGSKYCEVRTYSIEANDRNDLIRKAIAAAYGDGLEHVLVVKIDGKPTINFLR